MVELGKIGGDGISETERAALTELQNGDRHHRLRQRGDGEEIVGREIDVAFDMLSAERSLVADAPTDLDVQDRTGNVAPGNRCPNDGVSLSDPSSGRGRRFRQRRSESSQRKWPQPSYEAAPRYQ
jgi:hypothetical protein